MRALHTDRGRKPGRLSSHCRPRGDGAAQRAASRTVDGGSNRSGCHTVTSGIPRPVREPVGMPRVTRVPTGQGCRRPSRGRTTRDAVWSPGGRLPPQHVAAFGELTGLVPTPPSCAGTRPVSASAPVRGPPAQWLARSLPAPDEGRSAASHPLAGAAAKGKRGRHHARATTRPPDTSVVNFSASRPPAPDRPVARETASTCIRRRVRRS